MTEVSPFAPQEVAGPTNIDAEQRLLGCVLYDNDAFRQIEGITPEHFAEPFHGRMWALISERIGAGRYVDEAAVAEHFADDPSFQDLGKPYLFNLIEAAPPSYAAPELAAIVQDLGIRRELIGIGKAIAHSAPDRGLSAYDHVAVAEKALLDLAHGSAPSENNLIDARSSVEQTLAEIEHEAEHGRAKGLMTGLRCIDRRLRGLRPGQLVVIAGRPSMGKTALARQAAKGCAERNPNSAVAFFALEMNRRELDERMLSELRIGQATGSPIRT